MSDFIYAIGDIHGQFKKLLTRHQQIEAHGGKDAQIVHIGDLIDRGPESSAVLDYLIDGIAVGRNWIVLKGNHDLRLPMFYRDKDETDPNSRFHWLDEPLGGRETIASYGVDTSFERTRDGIWQDFRMKAPVEHAEFIDNLPLTFETDTHFFVHAGVDPDFDLNNQVDDDLLWIRKPFLDSFKDFGKIVVHGHTPAKTIERYDNRINIDTGAGYGKTLSAIAISGDDVFEIDERGATKVPRLPF